MADDIVELLFYFYLFVFGLIFGSFFNVVGLRTAEKQSIVTPRSHCRKCQHTLGVSELIPVVSYLWQKGRCKNCGATISWKYPFFEFVTACLFTISPLVVGWSKDLLVLLLLVSLIIIVSISDLHNMLIPNQVLLFFGIMILIIRIFIPTSPWWDAYAGAMLGFGLLYIIAVVSKGGMGGGDIKYFAVLGLFLGVKGILLTLFLAAFVGMLFGLIFMMFGKLKRKQPVPFAPFIGLAAWISYSFGEHIWKMYFQLL